MSGKYDVVFLLTKQQNNAAVVAFLKEYLADEGVIVTLQNGIPEKLIGDIVDGSSTRTTDYAPVPMVAVNNTDNSILQLRHVGGLLRITLAGVKATTQKVRVTFDKDVTGEYTVSNPDTDTPSIRTAGMAANNVVTYTVAASSLGATLAAGNIVLNVPVPCGVYRSVTVETLNASGTAEDSQTGESALLIARHYGKKLAFGEMLMEFHFGSFSNTNVVYTGGTGTLASSFVSYKSADGGEMKIKVPFTLEYYWDKDGTGEDWYTTPPSWLDASAVNTAGSTFGEEVALTASAQVNSAPPDLHHPILAAKTAKEGFDLSTINVSTGATVSRTTANCYVVQAPGTYKFPLVYGNGVVNNAVNESAYRGRNGVGGAWRADNGSSHYLGSFKDHLDQNIHNSDDASHSSPYLTTHLGKAASDFTAVLIWQDEPGLVEVDAAISGSGEDSYVTFSVPAATITQGNALVAVLVDGDDDGTPEIAWSWHIWVTEEDLSAIKQVPSGSKFAPVVIGWCDGKPTEVFETRSCQIRATQSDSGYSATATLTQTDGVVYIPGNCLFYQYGRKDPIQASNGRTSTQTNKTYYPSFEDYAPLFGVLGPVSIGTAIQNPYKQYSPSADWCTTVYYNTWSSTQNSTINATTGGDAANAAGKTKTIYDPSPVGFRIPILLDWKGLNSTNTPSSTFKGTTGRIYQNVLFFPAVGGRNSSGSLGSVNSYGFFWNTPPGSGSSNISYTYAVSTSSNNFDSDARDRSSCYAVLPIQDL